MNKSRFNDEQVIRFLRQVKAGEATKQLGREY